MRWNEKDSQEPHTISAFTATDEKEEVNALGVEEEGALRV